MMTRKILMKVDKNREWLISPPIYYNDDVKAMLNTCTLDVYTMLIIENLKYLHKRRYIQLYKSIFEKTEVLLLIIVMCEVRNVQVRKTFDDESL